jgi:hypothetical protein
VEVGTNIFTMNRPPHEGVAGIYPLFSFRIFNGARLSKLLNLGVETGFDLFAHLLANAKVRVNIVKKRITPVLDFSAGYSYNEFYQPGHGFNFNPSIGFKIWGGKEVWDGNGRGKAAFTVRAGYQGIYSRLPGGITIYLPEGGSITGTYTHAFHFMAGVEF